MPKGSLYNILHSAAASLEWGIRYSFAFDAACGLSYLHSKDFQHRDLKSLNVLVDDSSKAKLSDFGFSRIRTKSTATIRVPGSIPGSIPWMAPELAEPNYKFTKAADIFSFGVLLWEISSREFPWKTTDMGAMLALTWHSQGKREKIPTDCPVEFARLIECCWAQREEDRPIIDDVAHALHDLKM